MSDRYKRRIQSNTITTLTMQAQKQEERLDLQQQGTLFEYIKDSTNITLEVDKLSN